MGVGSAGRWRRRGVGQRAFMCYGKGMTAALKLPPSDLSVPDFLVWSATTPGRWELVDGAPRAMAPASRTHGALQSEVGLVLGMYRREQGGAAR